MDVTIGTVVIGGGQAGLVTGYYLARHGEPFVILDAGARVGDSWRQRYDSLRLFSFPRYASLPGWRIPVDGCPTRDEMADYAERYAARFALPVRTGVRVNGVSRRGRRFLVDTDQGGYLADQVVVATGTHQRASTPEWAALLDPAIRQLHSVSTGIRCNWRPETCWWSAPAIPAPTSRWRRPGRCCSTSRSAARCTAL